MSTLPQGKKRNKKKKRIKRSKGGSKLYFHMGTQAAIVAWQKTDDLKMKQDLYQEHIQPAFDKLVENLIFIYGFMSLHDSYEDLKSDCTTFLYQALPKFDEKKGSKAFAYFNVVAKHFLIIKSKQRVTKIKRNVSIDDPDSMGFAELEALREYCTVPPPDDIMAKQEFIAEIGKLLEEIRRRAKNDNEMRCIDSIIFIFNNVQNIDLLNKRAVFLYIREMSGLSAKQLTTTMSVIKKHYRELKGTDDFGIF